MIGSGMRPECHRRRSSGRRVNTAHSDIVEKSIAGASTFCSATPRYVPSSGRGPSPERTPTSERADSGHSWTILLRSLAYRSLHALGAPVGLVLVVHHQRICVPGGILFKGDFSKGIGNKEPGFGFGQRLKLILPSGLDEQPRSAHPDRHTDRDPRRGRAERAGVGDEGPAEEA